MEQYMKLNQITHQSIIRSYGEPNVNAPRYPRQILGMIEEETGNPRIDAFNTVIDTLNRRIAWLEALSDAEPSITTAIDLDVVRTCRDALRKVRDEEGKKLTEVRQPIVHGHWNPEFME
jgi:hypothetical protein